MYLHCLVAYASVPSSCEVFSIHEKQGCHFYPNLTRINPSPIYMKLKTRIVFVQSLG
ncbi:hypothetical protein Hanom_Chr05g00390451 [Helianthus anomalus]